MKGLSYSEIEKKIGRHITKEEFDTAVITIDPIYHTYRRGIIIDGIVYVYEV